MNASSSETSGSAAAPDAASPGPAPGGASTPAGEGASGADAGAGAGSSPAGRPTGDPSAASGPPTATLGPGGSSPSLTQDPSAHPAEFAQRVRTAENVINSESMKGAVGHNSGTVNNTFYGQRTEARPEPAGFEDELREAGELPAAPEPLPFEAALVERYVAAVLSGRVLVIEHHPGVKPTADHASTAIARSLLRALAWDRLLVEAFDRPFPLHRLYEAPTWKAHVQRSLIMLDRSRDDDVNYFLRDDLKTGVLRRQLERMDAYLLVIAASAAPRLAPGDRAHVWRFDPPPSSVPGQDSLPEAMEPFDVLLLMGATWFPGLAALEFRGLVDALLPPPGADGGAAPKPRLPRSMAGAAPPAPAASGPTREQRWREGDVDRVLGEVGIAFQPPSGPRAADAGYAVIDPGRRAAAGEWMLQRFPALLARHVDALTALYFAPGASPAFLQGMASFLLRLDAAQVFPLRPGWLVQRFLDVGLGHGESPDQLARLVAAALDRGDAEAFAHEVAATLVRRAREAERGLVDALGDAGTDENAAAGADAADRFWSRLDRSDAGGSAFLRTRNLLGHVVGALLLLCRRHPRLGVDGLYQLLENTALTVPDAAGVATRIDTLARLTVRTQLIDVLTGSPPLWLSIAEAVAAVPAERAEAGGPQGGGGAPSWPDARRALASDALLALSYHLGRAPDGRLAPELHDMLVGDTSRPRAARALAGLVLPLLSAGEGGVDTFEPVWVMWLFRTLAALMLRGQPARAASVPLQELVAPLRTGLRAVQRREISACMRATQEALLSRRDYFEAIGQRDALAAERQSLQAMQIVIRAFSGTAGAPVPG